MKASRRLANTKPFESKDNAKIIDKILEYEMKKNKSTKVDAKRWMASLDYQEMMTVMQAINEKLIERPPPYKQLNVDTTTGQQPAFIPPIRSGPTTSSTPSYADIANRGAYQNLQFGNIDNTQPTYSVLNPGSAYQNQGYASAPQKQIYNTMDGYLPNAVSNGYAASQYPTSTPQQQAKNLLAVAMGQESIPQMDQGQMESNDEPPVPGVSPGPQKDLTTPQTHQDTRGTANSAKHEQSNGESPNVQKQEWASCSFNKWNRQTIN